MTLRINEQTNKTTNGANEQTNKQIYEQMNKLTKNDKSNTRGGGGVLLDYGFICAVRTSFQISFQYAFLLKTTMIDLKFKMVTLKKSNFDRIFQIFY